ncbi:MAG: hypothetical protein ACYC6M_11775 [Terriglobales bacterium]
MSVSIEGEAEFDEAMDALALALASLDDAAVLVGILGDTAKNQRSVKTARGKGEALTNVQVGAVHEFGAPSRHIPQRSFLRATVDASHEPCERMLRRAAGEVIDGHTVTQAMERVGLQVQGLVQRRIAQGIPPPNDPKTIKRKGSSKPLIDTGQLRQSITFRVVRS